MGAPWLRDDAVTRNVVARVIKVLRDCGDHRRSLESGGFQFKGHRLDVVEKHELVHVKVDAVEGERG